MSAKTRKKYTAEFRAAAVRKMSMPGQSVQELAEELGLAPSLLFRWRRSTGMNVGVTPKTDDKPKHPPRRPQDWTSDEKLAVVMEAQGLTDEQLGGFLRQRGLHLATLEEWRETVRRGARAEFGGRADRQTSSADAKRIRELERDLARKDRALAETAALLVLQKKFQALMGGGDDDTEPRSGR
jgi:transposase